MSNSAIPNAYYGVVRVISCVFNLAGYHCPGWCDSSLGYCSKCIWSILAPNADSDSYSVGDSITVTDHLSSFTMSEPLLVQVLDLKCYRDRIDQVHIAAGGTYSYTLVPGGKIDWQM
jgi:hypothetical protein